jgi:hypothetical protein
MVPVVNRIIGSLSELNYQCSYETVNEPKFADAIVRMQSSAYDEDVGDNMCRVHR